MMNDIWEAALFYHDKLPTMSNYYLSKCCNAQVSEVWIDEFTSKYECHKCGEQWCDIYPVIDKPL